MLGSLRNVPRAESEFAPWIEKLSACDLVELLHEEHPLYAEQGIAAISRIRGWILHRLGKTPLDDAALPFVLEELETGMDPYLVGAAAKTLRSSEPKSAFAPYLIRAIENIRMHDAPIRFDGYGNEPAETSPETETTTALGEIFATLEWLGPHARGSLPALAAIRQPSYGLPRRLRAEIERLETVIGKCEEPCESDDCCFLSRWLPRAASKSPDVSAAVLTGVAFEDQDGTKLTFQEFFLGKPSIVVFFYVRCDNPQKCSLTVAKLARTQKILKEKGFDGLVRTAAISYDPEFDLPERMLGYGRNRGVDLGPDHRMLRCVANFDGLRAHFRLGVNFLRSLVNRHRLEVFILDRSGQVVDTFQRLQWNETDVADRAIAALQPKERRWNPLSSLTSLGVPSLGVVSVFGVAFFPKCPVCWAAYLSAFGIVGLDKIPYAPWLEPIFAALLLVNLAIAWSRSRATNCWWPTACVAAGSVILLAFQTMSSPDGVALVGAAITVVSSWASSFQWFRSRRLRKGK